MPAQPPAYGEHPIQGRGQACGTRGSAAEHPGATRQQDSSALPRVSTHLLGATAFWLPGAQGTPCRSVRTAIPAAPARRIAVLINNASAILDGTMNCGADDGTRVWLYLHPVHVRGGQKLTLAPVGCLLIGADGFRDRFLPEAVMRALAPFAPSGWRAYLHNGV